MRERNIKFPFQPCSTTDAEFRYFPCNRRLTLAGKCIKGSCRLKAENGKSKLKKGLSLKTFAGEYLEVFSRNIDTVYEHYSLLNLRKWRSRRQCVWRSALSKISNELQSGREGMVAIVIKNDMDLKIKAKMQRKASLPCLTVLLVTSRQALLCVTAMSQ